MDANYPKRPEEFALVEHAGETATRHAAFRQRRNSHETLADKSLASHDCSNQFSDAFSPALLTASSSSPSSSTTPVSLSTSSSDSNEVHQHSSHEIASALNVHAQDQYLFKKDCRFFHFSSRGCLPQYPCHMRHCFRSLGVTDVCQGFVNERSCPNPKSCNFRHPWPAEQPKHESHRRHSSRDDSGRDRDRFSEKDCQWERDLREWDKAERERDRDRDGRRYDRHSRK